TGGRLNGTITGRARMFRTVNFSALTRTLLFASAVRDPPLFPRGKRGDAGACRCPRLLTCSPRGGDVRRLSALPELVAQVGVSASLAAAPHLLVRELDDRHDRICLCVNSTIITTGSACA